MVVHIRTRSLRSSTMGDQVWRRVFKDSWFGPRCRQLECTNLLSNLSSTQGRLPIGTRSIVTWSVSPFYEEIDADDLFGNANRYGSVDFHETSRGRKVLLPRSFAAQRALAAGTGGVVVEVSPNSGSAMPVVASWLKDGYRLTIPAASVNDCGLHMLEVTVRGESASTPFVRCDASPYWVYFPSQLEVVSELDGGLGGAQGQGPWKSR